MKPDFGPNHGAVSAFVEELARIPWCKAVGDPTEHDEALVRVRLDDVVALHPHPYQLWRDVLIRHEAQIDRLILDSARLGADDALQPAVRITGQSVSDFFVGLSQDYPGYYKDSYSYVYELVDPPERLVLYAAREILVSDLAPELHFFGDLMPWFQRGHWPLGWSGSWPDGKLILW